MTGQATAATIEEARRTLADRRARSRFIAPAMLGEPAWDMLVDLFVQEGEGRRVSVTSLCYASGVSYSTALRWQGSLTAAGLVLREADPDDQRRTYLTLSPAARKSLTALFRAAVKRRAQAEDQRLVDLEDRIAAIGAELVGLVSRREPAD